MSAPPTELTALNMQLDAQARNAYGEEVNKRILQRRAAAQRAAILAQQQAGQQQNLYDQAAFQQQAAQQQGQIQTNRDVLLGQQQTERDKLLNAFHEGADYRQAGFQSERDYRLAVYQAMHAYDQAGYQQARDENQAWYQAGHAEQAANLQGRRDATLHGYSLESQTNQGNIQGQLAAQHGGIQAILAGQQDTFQQGRDTRLDQFQQNRDTRLNQFQNERDTRLDQFQQNRDERHVDLQGRLHQIQLTQDEEARMTRLRNAISRLDADPNLSPRDREEMRTQLMTGLDPLMRRAHESSMITQQLQQQQLELGNERGTLQNMALRDFQDNGTQIHTRTVRNDDGTERQIHFYTGQDGTMHVLPDNNAAENQRLRRQQMFLHLHETTGTNIDREIAGHNRAEQARIAASNNLNAVPVPHPLVNEDARARAHSTRVQAAMDAWDRQEAARGGRGNGPGVVADVGAAVNAPPAPAPGGNGAVLNNLIPGGPGGAPPPRDRAAANALSGQRNAAAGYYNSRNRIERIAGGTTSMIGEMHDILNRAQEADRGLLPDERALYEQIRQHLLDDETHGAANGLAHQLQLPEEGVTRWNGQNRYQGTAANLRPLLASLREHQGNNNPFFQGPAHGARNRMAQILSHAVENGRGLNAHERAEYARHRDLLNQEEHRNAGFGRLHSDTALPE